MFIKFNFNYDTTNLGNSEHTPTRSIKVEVESYKISKYNLNLIFIISITIICKILAIDNIDLRIEIYLLSEITFCYVCAAMILLIYIKLDLSCHIVLYRFCGYLFCGVVTAVLCLLISEFQAAMVK